jgi:osmoprotectant transport system ATP-binding protein
MRHTQKYAAVTRDEGNPDGIGTEGFLPTASRSATMIRLSHLSKTFDGGTSYAIRDLTLDVKQGETLVLLGSSGCGKTTTLKMINRLIEPTEGIIEIGEKNVQDHDPISLRRQIGYVFQGIGLFPHMTIEQNVGLVPRLLGWPTPRRVKRVQELLEIVGGSPCGGVRRPISR